MDNRSRVIYLEGLKAYKQKNFKLSASIFVRLAKSEKDSSVIHFFAGISLFMIKKYSLAVPFLKKVVSFKKNHQHTMKSCIFLGYIYIEKSMFEEAFNVLKVPVEESYNNPYVYSLMGYVAHSNKKYKEADIYFKKCLESDLDNPSFNNNYGYNLLVWKKDFDKSIPYLEKAIKQNRKNSAYLHSLGWALYQKKRYEEAYKILSLAEKDKSNTLLKRHLNLTKEKLKK